MAKFCGKCGSPLDQNGKCPKCEYQSGQMRQESQKRSTSGRKRVWRKIRNTVLLLAILFVGLFALDYWRVIKVPLVDEWLFGFRVKESSEQFDSDGFQLIYGPNEEKKVLDQQAALDLICHADPTKAELDQSQFGKCEENTFLGNRSYRFAQNYKGIPVYGRSMTVLTDEEGKCQLVSGNYLDFGDIAIDPKINEEEAVKIIRDQYGDNIDIGTPELTIYSLGDCLPQLAWAIIVNDSSFTGRCFVSAETSELISAEAFQLDESVEANGLDNQSIERTFLVERNDEGYVMHDEERNIWLYNTNGATLNAEVVIVDSADHVYSYDEWVSGWVDEHYNPVTITGSNFHYIITDSSGNVVGEDAETAFKLSTNHLFKRVAPVTSKDNTWSDKKAVTLMSQTKAAYDFYDTQLGRKSFDGVGGDILIAYNDDLDGDTTNAYSSGSENIALTVISFGKNNSMNVDTLGHEFTHSVEASISGIQYQGEAGALKEGTSDVFGEIIEDWYDDGELNDSCNWIHGKTRNLISPQNSKGGTYPSEYKGDGWVDTTGDKDHGGVHTNCTVISHAAYLMWMGVDGSARYEPLSTKNLAELFYSTFFSLPYDCTFAQYGGLLEAHANILYEKGQLSGKQRLCVSAALEEVGISPAKTVYRLSDEFDLTVYDLFGNHCGNYEIMILSSSETKPVEVKVNSYLPQKISLENGVYGVIITNGANKDEVYTFLVVISDSGDNSLKIYTSFSGNDEAQTRIEDDALSIPKSASEFNGHYYYVFDVSSISSWDTAQRYCLKKGGHLAVITSEEENQFIHELILHQGFNSAYFGFSDVYDEGNWSWANGELSDYTNWAEGEPNNDKNGEHYALFYHADQTDRWNDGDFGVLSEGGRTFICEWDDPDLSPAETEVPVLPQEETQTPVQTETPTPPVSEERDVVLVLDTSGSMSGDPMSETKKAAIKFVQTVLPQNAGVGIVTFNSSASVVSGFSRDERALTDAINDIYDSGATNTEAGLSTAYNMLRQSNANKRIIVLMSDGMPNNGREGQDLIDYANSIKSDDVYVYTLGFFSELSEGDKISAQALMEGIASDGCHYEVANADDLVFFFNDIADQINGQKYIYVRIACPVDVSVFYNGQRLNSAEDALSLRTDFGTLTFEQNEVNEENSDQDDRVKVLRLKEGVDYDVQIEGTGRGVMEYTIGFMDEDGKYSDFRTFRNVRITEQTLIDTVATVSEESILNVDEDGDGKYDVRYSAEANGYGKEIKTSKLPYIVIGADAMFAIIIILIILIRNHKNNKGKVSY